MVAVLSTTEPPGCRQGRTVTTQLALQPYGVCNEAGGRSDRAPVFGPRDPAFARAAGSHQLTEARVAPDRGSGPDLGFLRLWDCGNLFRPLIGPAMCEVLWDRSLP